jgi:hypothetical protein
MTYETKISQLVIKPTDGAIFSESATTVTVQDAGAGCFYALEQCRGNGSDKGIQITPDEWPHVVAAVERLFAEWEAQ